MKEYSAIGCLVLVFAILLCAICVPFIRAEINRFRTSLQKVDETTVYESIKVVEDTCRAMIASYTADELTYKQYAGSNNTEQQSWAVQAKMRANKTAATYNEYALRNSFVWRENVPADIRMRLDYIE